MIDTNKLIHYNAQDFIQGGEMENHSSFPDPLDPDVHTIRCPCRRQLRIKKEPDGSLTLLEEATPPHLFLTHYERIMAVVRLAAKEYGLKAPSLMGPSRARTIVAARQLAESILHRKLRVLSSPEAGRLFKCDHSSVLYGCDRVDALYKEDPAYAARVDRVTDQARAILLDPQD